LKKIVLSLALLLIVAPGLRESAAQNNQSYPAFTLHSRVTLYAPNGSSLSVSEKVFYAGSSGYSRVVQTETDGKVKQSFNRPAPPPSGKQLRSAPQFVRTEEILGITAYVHRILNKNNGELQAEKYYAPETGAIPLKTILYGEGGKARLVDEPVSISFGEPDAALLKEQEGRAMIGTKDVISGGVLNGKAMVMPAPVYPEEAMVAGAVGIVTVQIILDKEGKVEKAEAVSGHRLLLQAAVEAAYKARFSPVMLSGQPVKMSGVITYNFVLP
jgi:TonB family protein